MSRKNKRAYLYPMIVAAGILMLSVPNIASSALTESQADAVVEAEMTAKADRESEVRERLESEPAFEVFTVHEGGRRIIMRRVAPQPIVMIQAGSETPFGKKGTENGGSSFAEGGKSRESFPPVFITVYGDRASKIQWNGHTVWSNVAFTGLPAFGNIETNKASHSWFAILTEKEDVNGVPNLNFVSDDGPEYLVYGDEEANVPEDLFRDLDLLHAYYLANEKQLRADHQRAKTLEAARKRYLNANPPAPGETVINYSPIYSKTQ